MSLTFEDKWNLVEQTLDAILSRDPDERIKKAKALIQNMEEAGLEDHPLYGQRIRDIRNTLAALDAQGAGR